MTLKKQLQEAKKYKPQIKSIYETFYYVKKNKPLKYSATQRVLVNKGLLKPKKKFTRGTNPLKFTKKGYEFYKQTEKYKGLLK